MKISYGLIFLVALSALVGCATAQPNVDYDSCEQRGVLDGVKVARCKAAQNVK